MPKRLLEILLVVLVASLLGWRASRSHQPPEPLAFNGVQVGDKIADLEARLGPPDFKNPQAHYQQWEHPLTQLSYNEPDPSSNFTAILAPPQTAPKTSPSTAAANPRENST